MKASKLKIDSRTDKSYNSSSLGIQTIGKRNDYYQRLKEITRASGTATSCLQIKKKFVNGKGFSDEIGNIVVNRLGHTLNYIRSQATNDICDYGGATLHFNFNQNYRISEIFHVPFEFCRFSKADPDTGYFDKIAKFLIKLLCQRVTKRDLAVFINNNQRFINTLCKPAIIFCHVRYCTRYTLIALL